VVIRRRQDSSGRQDSYGRKHSSGRTDSCGRKHSSGRKDSSGRQHSRAKKLKKERGEDANINSVVENLMRWLKAKGVAIKVSKEYLKLLLLYRQRLGDKGEDRLRCDYCGEFLIEFYGDERITNPYAFAGRPVFAPRFAEPRFAAPRKAKSLTKNNVLIVCNNCRDLLVPKEKS